MNKPTNEERWADRVRTARTWASEAKRRELAEAKAEPKRRARAIAITPSTATAAQLAMILAYQLGEILDALAVKALADVQETT